MKSIMKALVAVVLGLVVAVLLLFTLAGGWYSVPRAWHFRKVVETADFAAVIRCAADVIHGSGAGREAYYHGATLTNLPKPIADLKPEFVSVSETGMVISFARGAEGFGLKIMEGEDVWGIHSYPNRPGSQMVWLTFAKNPKTGEPDDVANQGLPVVH
jgi:hypothetical protein